MQQKAGEEPGNEAKLVTVVVTLQKMWVKPVSVCTYT